MSVLFISSSHTEVSPEPFLHPSDPPTQNVPQLGVRLSPEQKQVLDIVKSGKNVFFTGSAGTGKSLLLREIIRFCRHRDRDDRDAVIAVTAATGIASVNIGGSTLHSWAGLGLGKGSKQVLSTLSKKTRQRWSNTRTLIIDEVSMIDGHFFDNLEYAARVLRGNSYPFGGIQLVLSGDFFQLPPVPDQSDGVPIPSSFAFEARSWRRCVGRPIVLKQVFRQTDQKFINMLNAMRYGNLDSNTIQKFRELSREVRYNDGIEPTDLFSTRKEVEARNQYRLDNIGSTALKFQAIDRPGYDDKDRPISPEKIERLLERVPAPKSITLKIGAQVMLTKNMIQGRLVNGSIGQVVDFLSPLQASMRHLKISPREDHELEAISEGKLWPLVRFLSGEIMLCTPETFEVNSFDGRVEAVRNQVPLILAWSLSIHKSQGQTLERVRVDLERIFERGQAYVALSRATSMDRLEVLNFDPAKVTAHARVIEWMQQYDDYREE